MFILFIGYKVLQIVFFWEYLGQKNSLARLHSDHMQKPLLWRRRVIEKAHDRKWMGVELYLSNRGTGIPYSDKRAHARVVSNLTYPLAVNEKCQFSVRDSKQLLPIFSI
ncbi:hypothetical protein ED312_00890 [Sinomicrobium pectinilyticum]|uniref:Uncharacterized protein n=1 Tax=Sinomicrobium pectinilyticum TaxID=1084421 RepID=A0A3N0F4V2_SINP1|nr:hypothetical protein ED312_00890 [Sinomicrobium pectinilyticum]